MRSGLVAGTERKSNHWRGLTPLGLKRLFLPKGHAENTASQLGKIIRYIKKQEEHHRKMTFREEFLAPLKKHRIQYDDRYLSD